MPIKKPRKRNDPAESTALIKKCAIALFAAKGYANTSLDEIAAAAKFTKGAIYYYFRNKEKLLLAILDDIEARSVALTAERVLGGDGTTLDRLLRFIMSQARWAAANPNDLAIVMLTSIESANKRGKVSKRITKLYDSLRETVEALLHRARAAGELADDAPVEKFVLAVLALHDGNMLLWYRSGLDPQVGRMVTRAAAQAVVERYSELRRSKNHASSLRATA